MEINVTKLFTETDAYDFSGSRFERGDNAAEQTWTNALRQAESEPILTTPEQLDAMRTYARSTGAWTAEEIAEWNDSELNALFIQFVSGDIREIEDLCSDEETGEIDWTKFQEISLRGCLSGSLYRADIGPNTGQIFYYLGE